MENCFVTSKVLDETDAAREEVGLKMSTSSTQYPSISSWTFFCLSGSRAKCQITRASELAVVSKPASRKSRQLAIISSSVSFF